MARIITIVTLCLFLVGTVIASEDDSSQNANKSESDKYTSKRIDSRQRKDALKNAEQTDVNRDKVTKGESESEKQPIRNPEKKAPKIVSPWGPKQKSGDSGMH